MIEKLFAGARSRVTMALISSADRPGRLCDFCYARYYGQTIATVPDAPCYSVALEEIYPQQGPPATRSGITGTRTREHARVLADREGGMTLNIGKPA